MKLKPFTDKATCPKCHTGWTAHRTLPKYCHNLKCKSFATQPILAPVPEHLHCACFECGYEWLMECADAAKSFPKADPLSQECPCPDYRPGCHRDSDNIGFCLMPYISVQDRDVEKDDTIYCPIDIDCPHCMKRIGLTVTSPSPEFSPIILAPGKYHGG